MLYSVRARDLWECGSNGNYASLASLSRKFESCHFHNYLLIFSNSNMTKSIIKQYERYCVRPSDINQHLPILKQYAQKCETLTEMGVRRVVSTWALLAANPKSLLSIDINPCPVEEVTMAAKAAGIPFEFKVGDTLKLKIKKTDFLFIDTLHTYDQLIAELELHAPKVSEYIVLHDTKTFGTNGQRTGPKGKRVRHKGLNFAVHEYLDAHPEWQIEKVFDVGSGLTILKRT